MAQQNRVENETTDFSGLASSLLPPSGAFFSAWTPQPWQNLAQSHNAYVMPGVSQPFTNSYHGASFPNYLSDSSTAYKPDNPNERGPSDHAWSPGEVSTPPSVVPSDSSQVQFYQVCLGSYCDNVTDADCRIQTAEVMELTWPHLMELVRIARLRQHS
jgi:hypothetical protein